MPSSASRYHLAAAAVRLAWFLAALQSGFLCCDGATTEGETDLSLGSPVSALLHPQGGAEAPQRVEVPGGTLAEARANPLPAPETGDVAIRAGDVVVVGAAGRLQARFDDRYGMLAMAAAPDLRADAAVRVLDLYIPFGTNNCDETADTVVRRFEEREGQRAVVVFQCRNEVLGCHVEKRYEIDAGTFEIRKQTAFLGGAGRVLAIESGVAVPTGFRRGGVYRQWVEHIGYERGTFAADSITEPYAMVPLSPSNGRTQTRILSLTAAGSRCGVGTYPRFIDGFPMVPMYQDRPLRETAGQIKMCRSAVLTGHGWRIPRGFLELGDPDTPRTMSWAYRFFEGSWLDFHAAYQRTFYRPHFARRGSLPDKRAYAADVGNHSQWSFNVKNGRAEYFAPAAENWIPLNRLLEDLSPTAWSSTVFFENWTDPLSDRLLVRYPAEKRFMAASVDSVVEVGRRWKAVLPRFRFGVYDGGSAVHEGSATFERLPRRALGGRSFRHGTVDGRPLTWHNVLHGPWFRVYQARALYWVSHGIINYNDFSHTSDRFAVVDGRLRVAGAYGDSQAAVRELARAIHTANGIYFTNMAAGPWNDIGYLEISSWARITATDFRIIADRLQVAKLHEHEPGSIVPLYGGTRDYAWRCLAYNLVPNLALGGSLGSLPGRGPNKPGMELVRLRWYLRHARMLPVAVRPVYWEESDVPLETAALAMPGTVMLSAINHGREDWADDFSFEPGTHLPSPPRRIYRASVVQGPWVDVDEEYDPDRPWAETPRADQWSVDDAEVRVESFDAWRWENGVLAFHDTIPARDQVFYFVHTSPVLVRQIDGRDVPWPVGSQPDVEISETEEGIRIHCHRDSAVLGIDPAFIAGDRRTATDDLGLVPLRVRKGRQIIARNGDQARQTSVSAKARFSQGPQD